MNLKIEWIYCKLFITVFFFTLLDYPVFSSDVNRPAKASAANRNRSGPMGSKSLEVDQKCVRLIDFSQLYQIFTLMTTLWTFGPYRSGPTRSTAEALAGRLTSLL